MTDGQRPYRSSTRSLRKPRTPFGSRTDVGCVREHNEDSLFVKPPLFVVADGMGGHAAGEVASEIAVNVIAKTAPKNADAHALGQAVERANRAIIDAAIAGEGREGMGTTCTAAILDKDQLVIAQVGDSRAYLMHNGELRQLTRDHSLMANMIEAGQITPEEARIHPNRSVITRALGNDPHTRPDLYEMTVEAGDRLLLCSDGLTSMLMDVEIEAIMQRAVDPQRCAAQLVNEAISAGGFDNVTVIVVDIAGKREQQQKRLALKTKVTTALIIVALAAIVGGAIWGVNTYLHNSAYLANENGYVAIYQGVPDSVMGLSYSELVEVTDIAVADLPAGAAEHINETLRVKDLDAAEGLIDQYRSDIEKRSGSTRPSDSTTTDEGASSSTGSSSTTSEGAAS